MGILRSKEEKIAEEMMRQTMSKEALKEAYTQQQIYKALDEENKKDNLYILLDNSSLLKEIELHLRGYGPTVNLQTGATVWEKKYRATMNDEGVQMTMQELHTRVGKNAILSNIPKDKAGEITFQCYCVLSRLFMAYSKKYSLDNIARTNVVYQICDMIYFSLTRGIDGVERENAYNNRKTIEHRQPDMMGKTKGGISAFFGA